MSNLPVHRQEQEAEGSDPMQLQDRRHRSQADALHPGDRPHHPDRF